MKRIIVAFLAVVFSLGTLQAAYLVRVPQVVRQPDGVLLHCFATGDEFYHWLHDANQYTIIQHPVTGYFVYADRRGTSLVATALIAGRSDPARAGLEPGLSPDPALIASRRNARLAPMAVKSTQSPGTTGTLNNLVIFIRFSDQMEFSSPTATFSNAFNATGAVSLREYFNEISGKQLAVRTSFYPESTGPTVLSYQDTNPRDYYCQYNETANPMGYRSDAESLEREMALLKNASEAVAPQIEESGLDFDNNHDGRIDNVCFIVKGATEGWSDLLWPHMWSLYTHDVRIAGLRVWNFNLQLSESFGVSVLCHEMSHTLGFPDLYRYTDKSVTPVGQWDVMAANASPPQHPGAYMKWKYGRWVPQLPEISGWGSYRLSLRPLADDPFAAVIVRSPEDTKEFFVVEYRRKTGMFESQVPGSGLVVYRITPGVRGNSDGPPDEVYVYRPGGSAMTNGELRLAFFSSETGRRTFNATSDPRCVLGNGMPGGIGIVDIGNAGDSISFTIQVGPTTPVMQITPDSCRLPFAGGSAVFGVKNNGIGSLEWSATVTEGAAWLHLTGETQGINAGTIDISADYNSENEARTGTVTFAAGGVPGSPKTVRVVQELNPPELEVTPASQPVGFDGGMVPFEITNAGGGKLAWVARITTGANWLRIISGDVGTNRGTLKLSVAPNFDFPTRTGTITITDTGGVTPPVTVTVVQAAVSPVLSVLPAIQHVGPEAGTSWFRVTNTGDGRMPWTALLASVGGWLQITSGISSVNTDTIAIAYEANPDAVPRTALITVDAGGAAFSPVTVHLVQEARSTGISETTTETGFSLYPNPTAGPATLLLNGNPSPKQRLEVINSLGKLEMVLEITRQSTDIDLNKLEKGIYFLRLTGENRLPCRMKVIRN